MLLWVIDKERIKFAEFLQVLCSFDAIHVRHAYIQQYDVWLQVISELALQILRQSPIRYKSYCRFWTPQTLRHMRNRITIGGAGNGL